MEEQKMRNTLLPILLLTVAEAAGIDIPSDWRIISGDWKAVDSQTIRVDVKKARIKRAKHTKGLRALYWNKGFDKRESILMFNRQLEDFTFRYETRIVSGTVSMVGLRMRGSFSRYRVVLEERGRSLAVSFCKDFGGCLILAGQARQGALCLSGPVKTRKGVWHRVEITMVGMFIEVRVDGRVMVNHLDSYKPYTRGSIALVGDGYLPGRVEYRNLEVREAKPTEFYSLLPKRDSLVYSAREKEIVFTLASPPLPTARDRKFVFAMRNDLSGET
ncbi:MAG TPA: DUF1080 domain-containing protein, partial [Planctomycetaceae bacterium]|nr:DUF1080 domain-containing protein [Planctomycetaceae bacterium]